MRVLKSSKFWMGFLALLILTVSVTLYIHAADLNKCHEYCAKQYPKNFSLYTACMDGCIHAD